MNRWRRVRIVMVAGAVALLAGCIDQSPVDADAAVTVGGEALAPDGAPLRDRPVRLGTGVTDADGALAVLSVGLSCVGDACTGDVWDTRTGANGRFRFDLEGRDTLSTFGEARSTLVSTSATPPDDAISGAHVAARFEIRTETLTLPPLALVDPGLRLSDDGSVRAAWSAAAPAPYEVRFESDDVTSIWSLATAETQVSVDRRILEDTAGRVVVSGRRDERAEGTDVAVTWRTPGIGYASTVGAPPSRGRPCRLVGGDGAVDDLDSPCPLTDGDLGRSEPAPITCGDGAPCPDAAAIDIELGRSIPAELVVVRGCGGGCAVETSGDGSSFAPVGSVARDHGTLSLPGTPITVVRVRMAADAFDLPREVSVWGPTPDAPLRTAAEIDDDISRRFDLDPGDDESIPWWLVAAAGGVAAVVLVGIGVAIGRRRTG